ncbi:toxin-antitoxin system YwqK family antitoxin [Carboxylicivirga sediminis]|uniref:Toxin-antitoxin system YwqK family antitoxin n=1 Tax=Carboxylicivirga sediminis TaxID=2006564 RepID=A0A941F1N6_9BACT|nr:toxin-antitoxin system YwqK family antitoxin [Carboxylicivirga sediminis]MBR8534364.1 toxin-antitoxin system YwqK family antitoxin [Carboxylicivirga sediminis]
MRHAFVIICLIISSSLLAQSYELYKGDTINCTDLQNRKQGLWIKFNNTGDKLLEQGHYKADKKDGLWVTYFPDGNIKHKITYKNGKAIGLAQFYYDNGLISEEGIWHIDHWQGNYKFYNKNGRLAYDWQYDDNGQRTGTQKYYHENGTLKYTGEWTNGKATGTLKIYNEEGLLVTERVYNDGEFMENVAITETITTDEVAPRQTLAQAKDHGTFKGTGNHTVYNLQGLVEKQGFFVNGKVFTGKHFFYNNDKQIIKVVHYQNGNVVQTEEY